MCWVNMKVDFTVTEGDGILHRKKKIWEKFWGGRVGQTIIENSLLVEIINITSICLIK